jgi:hypothetical protein
LESQKERYHYEDLEVGGEDIIKIYLREKLWSGMTGFIWLRIGTSTGLL